MLKAYMNVDQWDRPPLCPDETDIVLYTNYVYGRHCQVQNPINFSMKFCLYCVQLCCSYGRIYHESVFIRLCSKCADERYATYR